MLKDVKSVPELAKSLAELVTLDGTRAIPVKVPEDILPVLDVLPETSIFVEANRSAAVGILNPISTAARRTNKDTKAYKDSHQQLDSVEIKCCTQSNPY